jgi:hypothetical protein
MGVFDTHPAALADLELFHCQIHFRDRLMGGVPRDPRMIEGWLQKSMVGSGEERRLALLRTAMQVGLPVDEQMTLEDMLSVTAKLADSAHTQGFKRDQRGLYVESRTIKACLKEAISIRFPYAVAKFGVTKKAGKGYLAEHIFIWPSRLHLGVAEPDGLDLAIGHVTGPQGPRSTLGYHEYVKQRCLDFTVMVQGGGFKEDEWARIWVCAQNQGLGARRSAGHGTFEVTVWESLGEPDAELVTRIHQEDAQLLSDDPLEELADPLRVMADGLLR